MFRVPEVFLSYRLLQTVLFLTDSVFRVLFAYFDESMMWLLMNLVPKMALVRSILAFMPS